MKGRATACLSSTKNQLGNLVAADAANYTSSLTGATLLFAVGSVAKLSDSPVLAYVSFLFAAGEVVIAARQWSAARFFSQKPAAQLRVIADDELSEEEYHSGVEVKIKKNQ